MQKLKIDEWLVRSVQATYRDAASKVKVGNKYSNGFSVQVGVHQSSVLSPLLVYLSPPDLNRGIQDWLLLGATLHLFL
uniref:Reverse transcriptase domain-containing protein n=1 Tax=Octopus bimaculoides TaxID=37653 RepID=A0A0L8HDF3_OCTBM